MSLASPIRFIECEQGSQEWLQARLGIPTASMFHVIANKGERGKYLGAREAYLYQLAGERITGEIAESYDGGPLARGHRMEDEAREVYELITGEQCKRVGFAINDVWRAGASPDSLVGKHGGLEVKSKKPALHIKVIRDFKEQVPPEHVAQVQGTMGILQRGWWDFISYWPRMRPFIVRVERDEKEIARIKTEVRLFNDELDALVKELQS